MSSVQQYQDRKSGTIYYTAYIGRSKWGICRDSLKGDLTVCEFPFFSIAAAELKLEKMAQVNNWEKIEDREDDD